MAEKKNHFHPGKRGKVRSVAPRKYKWMLEFARTADSTSPDFLERMGKAGKVLPSTAEVAWREGWPRHGMPPIRDVVTGIDAAAVRAARELVQDEVPELVRAWNEASGNEEIRSRMDALRTRRGEAVMVQVARTGITETLRSLGRLSESLHPLVDEIVRRIPEEMKMMLDGPLTLRKIDSVTHVIERVVRAQAQLVNAVPALVRAERLVAGDGGADGLDDDGREDETMEVNGTTIPRAQLPELVLYELERWKRAVGDAGGSDN